MTKFQFAYGVYPGMTVTVKAHDYVAAVNRARETMDRRYEKRGDEPPVGWTLYLLRTQIAGGNWNNELVPPVSYP